MRGGGEERELDGATVDRVAGLGGVSRGVVEKKHLGGEN